jgi:hypothetical protein
LYWLYAYVGWCYCPALVLPLALLLLLLLLLSKDQAVAAAVSRQPHPGDQQQVRGAAGKTLKLLHWLSPVDITQFKSTRPAAMLCGQTSASCPPYGDQQQGLRCCRLSYCLTADKSDAVGCWF